MCKTSVCCLVVILVTFKPSLDNQKVNRTLVPVVCVVLSSGADLVAPRVEKYRSCRIVNLHKVLQRLVLKGVPQRSLTTDVEKNAISWKSKR